MKNRNLKELKKEVHKILFTLSSIEEKARQLDILTDKYNVAIGIANDGIGIFGIFVSDGNKPIFAETSNEFLKELKRKKKEFYEKLDNINSQIMLSNEKRKSQILELGKEYDVRIDINEKHQIIIDNNVKTSWLFFTEF